MTRSELGGDEAKGSVFGDQQNRSSGWGDSYENREKGFIRGIGNWMVDVRRSLCEGRGGVMGGTSAEVSG